MTKRIRKTRKHKRGKTRKRTKQRGGMFRAVIDSVLSRFQTSSSLVYANINFVKKLRPLLSQITKHNYPAKSEELKHLMTENKEQINNVIWVTTGNGRYTIHNPNDRVAGGTPMLLLQVLVNVPEYKKDRSIYHVFLDN